MGAELGLPDAQVRDGQGRKMSKSLGNVVDPVDTIAEYGTDALRYTLATGEELLAYLALQAHGEVAWEHSLCRQLSCSLRRTYRKPTGAAKYSLPAGAAYSSFCGETKQGFSEMSDLYGAGNTLGQDLNLSLDRVLASRNFANKLWNAGKFIDFNLAQVWC